MPRKEEWFTYDTTRFLNLNNHIGNKEKQCDKEKENGHLQHMMANLLIIYNLCFNIFFLKCRTDLS